MSRRRYDGKCCSVATWLSREELAQFRAIAAAQGVSPSAYLRAMVVDVLCEEGHKVPPTSCSRIANVFALEGLGRAGGLRRSSTSAKKKQPTLGEE